MSIRTVDFSAWTGEIQDEDWNYLWDQGIRLAIVQAYGGRPGGTTGPNPFAQQQVEGAKRRGMHLAAYTYPSWKWVEALDNLGPFVSDMQALALDVEARAPVHPDQITDLRNMDIRPIIYASANSWNTIMGDSPYKDTFSEMDVGLWVAYYPYRVWNGQWPVNVQEGMRYQVDSWQRCVGWQFAGTTTLSDETWDLNIFEDDFIVQPPDDCSDRLAACEGEREALAGALGRSEAEVANLQRTMRAAAQACDNTATSLRDAAGD